MGIAISSAFDSEAEHFKGQGISSAVHRYRGAAPLASRLSRSHVSFGCDLHRRDAKQYRMALFFHSIERTAFHRELNLMSNDRYLGLLNHRIVKAMNTRFDLRQYKEPIITVSGVTAILVMTLLFLFRS